MSSRRIPGRPDRKPRPLFAHFSDSTKNKKKLRSDRFTLRGIYAIRGIQELCRTCRRRCKVLAGPGSTFTCNARIPQ